jgi:arsenite-transporting ATPase
MRILFYTGKGGVGKSTMGGGGGLAAFAAPPVLVVSLDPAHNLGDVFGVTLRAGANASPKTCTLKRWT